MGKCPTEARIKGWHKGPRANVLCGQRVWGTTVQEGRETHGVKKTGT